MKLKMEMENVVFIKLLPMLLLYWISLIANVSTFQPDFVEPIINISVAIGRDATFTCHVRHLGGYRVGWVKADTKAIQAIHENVITHNSRVSISHTDSNTWNLHIKSVTEEDRGGYMCQLNTDPMKSQIGYLDVVIPPDFIAEDTSSDVIVPEGSSVKLTCRASGYPEPIVTWRREDGNEIVLKDSAGTKQLVNSYRGEVLKLSKISRSEMGSYLCIASNGVPPSVSKRISLSIHFHPVIQVPNQLVGAPLGTDIKIECNVEAFPKSINYWVKDTGEMIVSSQKFNVQEASKSLYETRMSLTVRKFQKEDVGSYRCIAKNSLGEVDSSIRLYEIPGPNRKIFSPKYATDLNDVIKTNDNAHKSNNNNSNKPKITYPPDDDEQYGSGALNIYQRTKFILEDFDDSLDLEQQKHNNNNIMSVKPTRTNANFDQINSNNHKNTIPIIGDLATRKPFVLPPIKGIDNNDATSYNNVSCSVLINYQKSKIHFYGALLIGNLYLIYYHFR